MTVCIICVLYVHTHTHIYISYIRMIGWSNVRWNMIWYKCELLRSTKSKRDSCCEAVTTCECTCRLQGSQGWHGDGGCRMADVEVRDHWPLKSILREKEANQLCGGSSMAETSWASWCFLMLPDASFLSRFLDEVLSYQEKSGIASGPISCSFSLSFPVLESACFPCREATSLWVVH